jgi:hypothetical protein
LRGIEKKEKKAQLDIAEKTVMPAVHEMAAEMPRSNVENMRKMFQKG